MKKIAPLLFIICSTQVTLADNTANEIDQTSQSSSELNESLNITNVANGFQSQVANNVPNLIQVMKILRQCNNAPYQIIPPKAVSDLGNLRLLNPFTGEIYSQHWKITNKKNISSQFPISNFNVYIETKRVIKGIPWISATKYEQEVVLDFVRYQDIVVQQYGHYIPSLIGFGFRAKLLVVTKNVSLDASGITALSTLSTLSASKDSEILSLDIQELGITSPTLTQQLNLINSAKNINERLNALTNYHENIQTSISNPDDLTLITPVIFSQKLQCSN